MMFVSRFVRGFIGFCILMVLVPPVAAATPTVTQLTPVNTQVGRYKRFEVNFQLSKNFPADSMLPYYFYDANDRPDNNTLQGRRSPYGVDGITIDAVFTSPSGKQLRQPAFYYQDYVRNGDTMTPTSTFMWKIRFAPEETGTYTYYVTVQDKEGSSRYPASGTLSFSSVSSDSKGFIRVSPKDPRFMAFSNGESFIPVGSGRQWWRNGRSTDYEKTFDSWKGNGINFTRVWDQNDGFALTVENHFDAYAWPDDFNPEDRIDINTVPRGTQMNQRGNYEEDKIIEAAERNGVYIQLCSHGDVYWTWDAAIYSEPWDLERWNPYPVEFDNPYHLKYWQRNFRYRVARWGYSTSVMAWEVWNEHGHVPVGSGAYNFYQSYGQYQKATDPYNHLRTTSQGSQAFSPAFWSSSAFDIANYHDYLTSDRYSSDLFNDEVKFVTVVGWCLRSRTGCGTVSLGDGSSWSGAHKPWVWGEFDIGATTWDQVNPAVKSGDGRIRMLHNTLWAGMMGPLGTTPIDWYFDGEDAATTAKRYTDRKAASTYFRDVDLAGGNMVHFMTANDAPSGYTGETATSTNTGVRVIGMRRADKTAAYVWIQNRNSRWNSLSPAAVSATVTIGNLLTGSYRVEKWNTANGTIESTASMTPSGSSLTLSVNNLTTDTAYKLISGAQPGPQPTATPGSTGKPGDANGDGRVDGSDYVIWVKNFNKQVAGGAAAGDFNADGRVDGSDYVIWVRNFNV